MVVMTDQRVRWRYTDNNVNRPVFLHLHLHLFRSKFKRERQNQIKWQYRTGQQGTKNTLIVALNNLDSINSMHDLPQYIRWLDKLIRMILHRNR